MHRPDSVYRLCSLLFLIDNMRPPIFDLLEAHVGRNDQ